MSTTEILKKLPKLSAQDRRAILRRLLELEESPTSPATRNARRARKVDYALLTRNPSFAFLREEPNLYE